MMSLLDSGDDEGIGNPSHTVIHMMWPWCLWLLCASYFQHKNEILSKDNGSTLHAHISNDDASWWRMRTSMHIPTIICTPKRYSEYYRIIIRFLKCYFGFTSSRSSFLLCWAISSASCTCSSHVTATLSPSSSATLRQFARLSVGITTDRNAWHDLPI